MLLYILPNYWLLCLLCVVCVCFLFQAEDGIRYLVRSRGLGDVYKRQVVNRLAASNTAVGYTTGTDGFQIGQFGGSIGYAPVSYTHLTLPTSDLV